MADYLQHARRHRSQGSDPIPGVGSAAWAILSGALFSVGGSDTDTIPAGSSGTCRWSSFVMGGDLSVFASHNNVNYPGYPTAAVPPVSDFHNTSGDEWVFATKTGILLAWFDVGFSGASFPLHIARNDGNSNYQGGEPFGPQTWDSDSLVANIYSWSWIRPIDNDPFDIIDPPGDGNGLYYEFLISVENRDSADHTLDGENNFQLALAWNPVEAGSLNFVY